MQHEVYIVSASCLFNYKLKITLAEIAKEWAEGTVVVAKKPNGKFHFIAGCQGDYYPIGTKISVIDQQTLARKGTWEVVNQINYSQQDGSMTVQYKATPITGVNMVDAANIAVFK